MRKKILFMLSAFCFMGATVFGQAIEGGAGVIHVDGNPNLIVGLNTVTVNEGNLAYDKELKFFITMTQQVLMQREHQLQQVRTGLQLISQT